MHTFKPTFEILPPPFQSMLPFPLPPVHCHLLSLYHRLYSLPLPLLYHHPLLAMTMPAFTNHSSFGPLQMHTLYDDPQNYINSQ